MVEAFRARMRERLIEKIKADEELKERFISFVNGEYNYEMFNVPAYATFRRLFIVKGKKVYYGNRTTRDLFALYFGAASFEDYAYQHGIIGDKEFAGGQDASMPVISVGGEATSPSAPKEEHTVQEPTNPYNKTLVQPSKKWGHRKRPIRWAKGVAAAVLLLIVTLITIATFTTEETDRKVKLLVRNDKGLIVLDPTKNTLIELISHEPITGLDYDPASRTFFWSIFNGCPYCGISKATINETFTAIEPGSTKLFITKEVSEPCGIALDPTRQLIYCANHGNQTISVYDYNGKTIKASLIPSLEGAPSSLEIDLKNQFLYWTDIVHDRIGRINLKSLTYDSHFLTAVGCRPDGLSLDQETSRLYWASSESNEVGWADLQDSVPIPRLFKTPEMPAAVEIDVDNHILYYSTENGDCLRRAFVYQDTLVLDRKTGSILVAGGTRPGIIKRLVD